MAGITQIMLGMGSGPKTLLQNHTITGSPEANPFPPPDFFGTTCSFTFKSDGTALATPGFSGSTTPAVASGEWLTSGNPADCELFVSETSGTVSAGPTTGALSTWQAMTSDLAYGIQTTGPATKSTTINCQVRNKNTLAVIGTCDITFTVS